MQVTYKDHMGSDLQVVNAARVSFSGESEWADQYEYDCSLEDRNSYSDYAPTLKPKDEHLIKFLARGCTTKDWDQLFCDVAVAGHDECVHTETTDTDKLRDLLNHVKRMPSHWVPFANGGQIKMHFKVPLFVARQLQKHTAGFNPWSEVSRRYVDSDPEFYVPGVWRGRSADKKQGSSGEAQASKGYFYYEYQDDDSKIPYKWQVGVDTPLSDVYDNHNDRCLSFYRDLLDKDVCPEQARMVLPQAMMTEFVWSGNLYAWASLYNTRSWGDSQAETANVAQQIKTIVEPLFPVSWRELTQ